MCFISITLVLRTVLGVCINVASEIIPDFLVYPKRDQGEIKMNRVEFDFSKTRISTF